MQKALLLIDIQNDYFKNGKMELLNMHQAAENSATLLKLFRKNNLPIFHIQHFSTRPGASFFLPDTDGVHIHNLVSPLQEEEIISKNYPNSFRETKLLQKLKEAKIEHLVIVGAMTHMCIDATTRAAWDLGFTCEVIADACATKKLEFNGVLVEAKEVHFAFLAALNFVYAKVKNLDIFLSEFENIH